MARAKRLEPLACDIVAGVTGVAGGDGSKLVTAVGMLTPEHLQKLRKDFRRMNTD